jgi:predicted dinucleotide-binding enzyme
MKFGVLGTGMVGHALSTRLVELGHEVTMGSRQGGNAKAVEWAAAAGPGGHEGSFGDAAKFGEVVMNATAGVATIEALTMAGAPNLAGKVLVDISNPLSSTADGQPSLTVVNTDSLGEQIQRAFPEARVVKALNTMTSAVMVHPEVVPGTPTVFLCGNDPAAKVLTAQLLESFGWPSDDIMDLGDIVGARAMEMFFPLWLRMAMSLGNWTVTIKALSGPPPNSA